jgi:hypothetical protein
MSKPRRASRLTKQDDSDLHEARWTLCNLREDAERGDANAKMLVARARETISRLTAKRDNRIWL